MSFVLGDFGDCSDLPSLEFGPRTHPDVCLHCLWTLVPSPTLCPLAYMRIPYHYSNGVGAAKPLRRYRKKLRRGPLIPAVSVQKREGRRRHCSYGSNLHASRSGVECDLMLQVLNAASSIIRNRAERNSVNLRRTDCTYIAPHDKTTPLVLTPLYVATDDFSSTNAFTCLS